ncbi:MAG: class II aldolase/adducin family protein [Bacteroidia bacterium]|nr:class II aldolase/adducin family protein [Bacteroidia bacterium]
MKKLDTLLLHPADQITEIIHRIYKAGMTTTSGGNISIRDNDGNIWVTPSAVDKGSLRREDIVCVKRDGTVEGKHKPSSEYPLQKAIYEVRTDLKSVIHAHPPALVFFSIVRQIPDTNVIPQARIICGPIGYAEYSIPGGEELGRKISAEFSKGFNAVIMENHGTVIGGTDLKDAYIRFETLEFAARTIIGSHEIGKPVFLSDEEIEDFESKVPADMPEMKEVSYSPDELMIRSEISKLVRRACDQGLMISSYGTVSVRWKGEDFLITPRNVPRWEMGLEDIIQIKSGKREPGKLPSRAVTIHQEIYRLNQQVNSIITSQTPNIMAFGISNIKLDVRTIPESWIFLQDIPIIPFGVQFSKQHEVSGAISIETPAVIIQNDSAIITGNSLLQTFDRLEVAEFSAKSLIMSKPLGKLIPIDNRHIEDLRIKFLGGH